MSDQLMETSQAKIEALEAKILELEAKLQEQAKMALSVFTKTSRRLLKNIRKSRTKFCARWALKYANIHLFP